MVAEHGKRDRHRADIQATLYMGPSCNSYINSQQAHVYTSNATLSTPLLSFKQPTHQKVWKTPVAGERQDKAFKKEKLRKR
eukprot:705051-Pelagomonas_calceolata.AAC.3